MRFFAKRRKSPERAFRKKKTQILTIFALVKYREYRVIIVSIPKISCNIVWTRKKDIAEGWSSAKKKLDCSIVMRPTPNSNVSQYESKCKKAGPQ